MDERKKSILATKTKEELFKLDLSKSLNGVGEYRATLEAREKQDGLFDVYKVKKMQFYARNLLILIMENLRVTMLLLNRSRMSVKV